MFLNLFSYFSSIFIRNTGSEGPLRVQKIENFGSSQNHPKSIGIDQESIISHFGIIKTPKIPLKTCKKTGKTQQSHKICAVFWALLDPVLGPHAITLAANKGSQTGPRKGILWVPKKGSQRLSLLLMPQSLHKLRGHSRHHN